jgi:hypothetical protein
MNGAASIASRLSEFLADSKSRGVCLDFAFVDLPGQVLPWTDSGLDVSAGQAVTVLAQGEIVTAAELGMMAGARFHLWRRITPGGDVVKGTQDTTSFRAERSGRLELAVCHGEWSSRSGDIETPAEAYAAVKGGLEAVVIVWPAGVAPEQGIEALHERVPGDPGVAAEAARLAAPVERPGGWEYLWFLGESDAFRASEDGGIRCHTRDDAAILRREVDVPTSPDASLVWRWRVDALPSAHPEDTLPTHDYLSIAVEWDCGRDLTYLWSHSLEVGRVFTCPIPVWAPRETHVVVRSGTSDLGRWCEERRDLYADYRQILGNEPGRIVAVWLIAVSLFQHGEGRAEFASIQLESAGQRIDVQ